MRLRWRVWGGAQPTPALSPLDPISKRSCINCKKSETSFCTWLAVPRCPPYVLSPAHTLCESQTKGFVFFFGFGAPLQLSTTLRNGRCAVPKQFSDLTCMPSQIIGSGLVLTRALGRKAGGIAPRCSPPVGPRRSRPVFCIAWQFVCDYSPAVQHLPVYANTLVQTTVFWWFTD